ncbi:CLUMA_CG016884, isoform A [Clunio marinus]|uniref:CLUMA_CG016884, isoform A n=1 Tax=Clunio marinus TaxID=568069 RepID=A0A1J1ITX6_9DIPT|nr:CLUMA_CG016884, isoform A [Clunio marinus]
MLNEEDLFIAAVTNVKGKIRKLINFPNWSWTDNRRFYESQKLMKAGCGRLHCLISVTSSPDTYLCSTGNNTTVHNNKRVLR